MCLTLMLEPLTQGVNEGWFFLSIPTRFKELTFVNAFGK
jgi:hypothetical protein